MNFLQAIFDWFRGATKLQPNELKVKIAGKTVIDGKKSAELANATNTIKDHLVDQGQIAATDTITHVVVQQLSK